MTTDTLETVDCSSLQLPKTALSRVPQFSYEGAKGRLRKWIINYVPLNGSLYVEPFAGRGNLFWLASQCKRYERFLLNDLRTYRFYEALRVVDVDKLPTALRREEEVAYRQGVLDGDPVALVMEPKLAWAGQNLIGNNYKAGKYSADGTPWSHYNQVEYRARVSACQGILTNPLWPVDIKAVDFLELPWEEWAEDPSVFVYLDPPYLDAVVGSYGPNDFRADWMVELLLRCRCRWLLSEYLHPLYIKHLGRPLATKRTTASMFRGKPTELGGRAVGYQKPQRVECLWANFRPLT